MSRAHRPASAPRLRVRWRRAAAISRLSPAAPIGFLEAMLFQWINPKGWVIAMGALAAYTTVGGDLLLQTSMLASVLAAACFASVVVWAGFGAAIARFLESPLARIAFNWSMAGLLVISLLPVFWNG